MSEPARGPPLKRVACPLFGGKGGDVYGVQFVDKISSKRKLLRRVVMLCKQFLLQGEESGAVTRIISYQRLRAIHYDAGLNRAAFVSDGSERDWVVVFTNDHRNTFIDPAKFLEAVSTLSAYYYPEGPVPVTRGPIPPYNTLNLILKPGMKTVRDVMWCRDKYLNAPLRAAPCALPPGAVQCIVILNNTHEELGLEVDGTEIVSIAPSSPFARACVPLGQLLTIDEQPAGGLEDIKAVVRRKQGVVSFRVAVMPVEKNEENEQ